MVAGSGPTDRDWNSPFLPGSNGSAPLLADALAAAGIASLRYDKTGSGPNVRENMQGLIGKLSMQSHVDELAGAVRTIASQDYVQDGKIFALTNSEGALHALNYQLNKPEIPFAGVVLTAPPGRAVGAVARSQLAAQATGVPNGNELIAAYDAAIARFLVGKPAAPEASLPEGVRMLLQSLENPANLPFARELWAADGAALLRKVAIPVLVIIGKRDIHRLASRPVVCAANLAVRAHVKGLTAPLAGRLIVVAPDLHGARGVGRSRLGQRKPAYLQRFGSA